MAGWCKLYRRLDLGSRSRIVYIRCPTCLGRFFRLDDRQIQFPDLRSEVKYAVGPVTVLYPKCG